MAEMELARTSFTVFRGVVQGQIGFRIRYMVRNRTARGKLSSQRRRTALINEPSIVIARAQSCWRLEADGIVTCACFPVQPSYIECSLMEHRFVIFSHSQCTERFLFTTLSTPFSSF